MAAVAPSRRPQPRRPPRRPRLVPSARSRPGSRRCRDCWQMRRLWDLEPYLGAATCGLSTLALALLWLVLVLAWQGCGRPSHLDEQAGEPLVLLLAYMHHGPYNGP